MYQLIRSLNNRTIAASEVVSCVAAMLIANRFYVFHSFLLECGAFLLTWLVLDWTASALQAMYAKTRVVRS